MNEVMNVWYSTNENAWLSNLAHRPISDKYGRQFVSVEHAYQTYKSGVFDETTYKANWAPGRKIVGKLGTKTDDNWNIRLMERLVIASVDQNDWFRDDLNTIPLDMVITHKQDRGIWREEFPNILKNAQNHAYRLVGELQEQQALRYASL